MNVGKESDKNGNKASCTHLLLTQVILSRTCSSVDEMKVFICLCLYLSLQAHRSYLVTSLHSISKYMMESFLTM